MSAKLNLSEHLRYARQIALEKVGIDGQEKLKTASVLVVGVGGLGSSLSLYLAAAGVGHLGLVDFDVVKKSNLHRQILHTDEFLEASKLDSAHATLKARNPHIRITLHNVRLQKENAMDILGGYDIVADCSDNFATRYLVNDACVILGIPNAYGNVYQFEGQVTVLCHSDGPCYRCLHPNPPPAGLVPTCAESGVLGVLPGLIGILQANEVLKLLLNIGRPLIGRMTLLNALDSEWKNLTLPKNDDCHLCGKSPTIDTLIDYEDLCGTAPHISATELKTLKNRCSSFFLLDVRRADEAAVVSMGADQLIPVESLPDRLSEIKATPNERIVVHCQTGLRSRRAVQILHNAGYPRAVSLDGGILAWVELQTM
ncbi:MAG: molybdopterin-synthase adenylyltransferase MoeB [Rhodothermaceae bacterium]|nr:molybdopterin-synthase adenylyltransferase MoeB [Rhodothermaceae bacterium]